MSRHSISTDWFPNKNESFELMLQKMSELPPDQYQKARRQFAKQTHSRVWIVDRCVQRYREAPPLNYEI